MAGSTTEQIKQRLDIVDLIQEYVRLTKAGTNWKGLCPFHHERSPSFVVSPDKQMWHCFGCDKGGDVFSFVQEIDGVDFSEALRQLAQRTGVELVWSNPEERNKKTRLLECVHAAQQFYQTMLEQDPTAQIARDYITKRNIQPAMQQQFGLGYSPDAWDKLYQFLLGKGWAAADMVSAGLVMQKSSGYYDRFRGRLMFPLTDVNGTVVGFTARTLHAEAEGGKYINSPQSEVYDKSKVVYGLALAKQTIKQLHAAIIVEGNVDVIAAHQAGFRNVVATSGTALTDEQLVLLKRYTPNVILGFDMDSAGLQASQRAINLAQKHALNIRVLQLPNQFKDPDECLQADPALFKQAIRDAVHIIDFLFHQVTKDLDLQRVEHKKRAVQQLLPVLAQVTDQIEQAHFTQQLADMVQVEAEILQRQLPRRTRLPNQAGPVTRVTQPVTVTATAPVDRYSLLSRQALSLIVTLPDQFKYCSDYLDPAYLSDPAMQDLYNRLLSYYNIRGSLDVTAYLESQPEDTTEIDTLELLRAHLFPETDLNKLQEELIATIRQLHRGYIQRRLQRLEAELKAADNQHRDSDAQTLMQEFQFLTQQLTELHGS